MFGTQGIWSAAWGLVLGACVGEWADGSGAAALQGAAASAPEPAGWTGPGGDVTTFLPHGVLARNLSRGVEGRWVGGVATLRPLGSVEGVDVSLSGFGRPGDMRPVIEGMASAGPCQSDGALDADGGCLRRVEISHEHVVEWWENREDGLEQGFTVDAPPGGVGPLVLELTVDGGVATLQGESEDGAILNLPGGQRLRYDHLSAWDARGVWLPTWMEATASGLRLYVDDSEAVGGVTVDPIVSETADWTYQSDEPGAYFGASLDGGDVDGDGFSDLIIGAYLSAETPGSGGMAQVFAGSSTGLLIAASWLGEGRTSSAYGFGVAIDGDVNGDGFRDAVVGAYSAGEVTVHLGGATGLEAAPSTSLTSRSSGDAFGYAVAHAGDVDGDGFGDVLVGAPFFDGDAADQGLASLFRGSPGGLVRDVAWFATPEGVVARFGLSVASAGDVNADGFADVLVGAPDYDQGAARGGAVFAYYGSSSGLSTRPSWVYTAGQPLASLGISVASAGDVNGDGFDDVVVGASRWDSPGTDHGAALLFLGGATGLSSSPSWQQFGENDVDWLGYSVDGAGDVDGDGYDDVLVGTPYYDSGEADEGRVQLYRGGPGATGLVAAWHYESNRERGNLGAAVRGIGDVDGDGFDDIAAGGLHEGMVDGLGFVVAFRGHCLTDFDADGLCPPEDCDDADPAVGEGTPWYTDVDRDGFGTGDPTISCSQPIATAIRPGDCDDANPDVRPDAQEVCDGAGVDEDCDGLVDQEDGFNADGNGSACGGMAGPPQDDRRTFCGCTSQPHAGFSALAIGVCFLSWTRRRARSVSQG